MADFNDTIFVGIEELTISLPVPDDVTAFRDITTPVVTIDVATPNPLLKDSAIVVDVIDSTNALRAVVLMAFWAGKNDAVWDGSQFTEDYDYASTREVLSASHHRYTVRRDFGWPVPLPPEFPNMRFRVLPVDVAGNMAL